MNYFKQNFWDTTCTTQGQRVNTLNNTCLYTTCTDSNVII